MLTRKHLIIAGLSLLAAACSKDEKPEPPEEKVSSVGARVIYGDDNRLDLYEVRDALQLSKAASTAALISNFRLQSIGNGQIKIETEKFAESYRLCPTEPFAEQDVAAFCSGFFVGQDVMVTAGHCIRSQRDCDSASFVFDFALRSPQSNPTRISESQVYRCKALIKSEVASNGVDFSIVRLERPVTGRVPLSVRQSGAVSPGAGLFVIGHPAGLPTKVAGGATVRKVTDGYFVADLDTYGGNSGSAVFNQATGVVEGILVRGETDFRFGNGCRVSNVCTQDGCRGEDVTRMDQVAATLSEMGL